MPKKRIVVHAGLPKCGSTALQLLLASNTERLQSEGYFYPTILWKDAEFKRPTPVNEIEAQTGMMIAHHYLFTKLVQISNFERENLADNLLHNVLNDFDKSSCHTLILSSESIAIRAYKFESTLFECMHADYQLDLILFVRRYDRWLRSMYKQLVKADARRYWKPFSHFVKDDAPVVRDYTVAFSIATSLRRLIQLFQPDCTYVKMLGGPDADSVALFSDVLGCSLGDMELDLARFTDVERANYEIGQSINQSPSDGLTLFYTECNRFGMNSNAFIALKTAVANQGGDFASDLNISLLAPDLSKSLLDFSEPDFEQLKKEYGIEDFARGSVETDAQYRERLKPGDWARLYAAIRPLLTGEAGSELERINDVLSWERG